jgi:hypothetical protein
MAGKQPILNVNLKTIGLKRHRGVVCLESMPEFLVWGFKNTVLECRRCLRDGLYHNVLVGMCLSCRGIYEGILDMPDLFKYGFYFPETGSHIPMKPMHSNAFLRPANIFIPQVQFKPGYIPSLYAYTMYNLAHLSSQDDITLLLDANRSPFADLSRYYNLTSPDKRTALINAIAMCRQSGYKTVEGQYAECAQVQKEFRMDIEKTVCCEYCGKEVGVSTLFKNTLYCSYPCHTRSQELDHKNNISDDDDLPDLVSCDDDQDE